MKQSNQVIIAGAVVVLLLAGIGIWNKAHSNLGSMAPQQQKAAVTTALTNLFKAHTYHLATNLTLNLSSAVNNKLRPFPHIVITTNGDVSQGSLTVFIGTLNISAQGQGNTLSSHGELRALPKATAFKLAEIPLLLNPSGNLVNKWTYVPTPLLNVTDSQNIMSSFTNIVQRLSYGGTDKIDGQEAVRFSGSVTPDQQKTLAAVLSSSASGSPVLDQLSRILSVSTIKNLSVWTDSRASKVQKIEVDFTKSGGNSTSNDFATLTLAFSDYGKAVKADNAPVQLTVKPEAFAQFFGGSQIAKN
jgi:hypothetical protein